MSNAAKNARAKLKATEIKRLLALPPVESAAEPKAEIVKTPIDFESTMKRIRELQTPVTEPVYGVSVARLEEMRISAIELHAWHAGIETNAGTR